MERTFDQRDGDRGTTVLIVDDEESIRANLNAVCGNLPVDVPVSTLCASDLPSAMEILARASVNVVLLDKNIRKPDGSEDDGIEAIPEMLQLRPQLQILIVSGSRESQDIVKAMRYGAFGFVTKGIDDELLPAQIGKAIEVSRLVLDKTRFERGAEVSETGELVGKSPAVSRLRVLIPQLAETDGPVLLLGETGTGKTTLAKLIHHYRKRYLKQERRPFFYVNIAALSPTLVERELFGAEPGSYTGASKVTHQGFFELANTGTLFLDEIADITPEVQTKLLEVLQEGTFYRVGGTKKISSSFKLICATNKNLYELAKKKQFREDLYWRIAALPIELPPLRERREDIPDLIRAVLPSISRKCRAQIRYEDLPEDFIEYFSKNPPEGNIRGLEQKLTQLLTLCPKDKSGTRLLQYWKRVPELCPYPIPRKRTAGGMPVSLLMNAPIDTSDPEFPGFHEFLASMEKQILLDARSRYGTVREIASALKLSKSVAGHRLKQLSAPVAKADIGRWPQRAAQGGEVTQ